MVSFLAMDNLQLDLKTLLEHDLKMAQNLVEASRSLVLDVQASHYWTAHSLETFALLTRITGNTNSLLDALGPYWGEGNRIFKRPEAVKLWKTAAGLWSALPPEQKKFNDHLARRRRERIMGEEITQPDDIEPETLRRDEEKFALESASLNNKLNKLVARLNEVPEGIAPSDENLAEHQPEPPKEGEVARDVAPAPASPEQPQ